MTLGKSIRDARIKAGLSQEALAKALGTTKQAISKYENDIVNNIPMDKVVTMASLLSVPPAYLMGGEMKGLQNEEFIIASSSSMSNFASVLKKLRCESRLSQQALADMIGVSKSIINMYERGERKPKYGTLRAIAQAFNVDIRYLLGEKPKKQTNEITLKTNVREEIYRLISKDLARDRNRAVQKYLYLFEIEIKKIRQLFSQDEYDHLMTILDMLHSRANLEQKQFESESVVAFREIHTQKAKDVREKT